MLNFLGPARYLIFWSLSWTQLSHVTCGCRSPVQWFPWALQPTQACCVPHGQRPPAWCRPWPAPWSANMATWYQQKLHQKITKNQKCVELCGVLFIYTYDSYDVHMHKHKHMYYIIWSICLSIHPYIHLSTHLYVEFLRYASQLCRCQLERPLNTTTIWPMFDKSRQQLSLAPQAKRGRGTGYSPHLRWKIVKSHGYFPKWPVPWAHEFQYDLN